MEATLRTSESVSTRGLGGVPEPLDVRALASAESVAAVASITLKDRSPRQASQPDRSDLIALHRTMERRLRLPGHEVAENEAAWDPIYKQFDSWLYDKTAENWAAFAQALAGRLASLPSRQLLLGKDRVHVQFIDCIVDALVASMARDEQVTLPCIALDNDRNWKILNRALKKMERLPEALAVEVDPSHKDYAFHLNEMLMLIKKRYEGKGGRLEIDFPVVPGTPWSPWYHKWEHVCEECGKRVVAFVKDLSVGWLGIDTTSVLVADRADDIARTLEANKSVKEFTVKLISDE